MNNNLTISTLAFNLVASDLVDGSLRREISRGVNLPEEMRILNKDIVNSKTKLVEHQTSLQILCTYAGTDGLPIDVVATLTLRTPKDPALTSNQAKAPIVRLLGILDDTSPNLDLVDEIFVVREQ
jgi:hypothetical protein